MTFPHAIPDELSQHMTFSQVPDSGKESRENELKVEDIDLKDPSQTAQTKKGDVGSVDNAAMQDSVSPVLIEGNDCSRSESISPCPPMSSEDAVNEDVNSLVSQVPEPLSNPNIKQESQDQSFVNETDISETTPEEPTDMTNSGSSDTFPLDCELEPVSHFYNYTVNQTTHLYIISLIYNF